MATAELVLTDSAALALLDNAEAALAAVESPEDANQLWRRIKAVEEASRLARVADVTVAALTRVRLRAKRRWGELLGPAEPKTPPPGGVTDGNATPGADRLTEHRARKLAAVPSETFEAALVADDPDKAPSEASVLRRASGAVHFSSAQDEWETPQDLYDELDREFKFELDVCALDSSAKCPTYFTPKDDGLAQDWKGFRCWMNPPYGEVIGNWIDKAYREAQAGATVVCREPQLVGATSSSQYDPYSEWA